MDAKRANSFSPLTPPFSTSQFPTCNVFRETIFQHTSTNSLSLFQVVCTRLSSVVSMDSMLPLNGSSLVKPKGRRWEFLICSLHVITHFHIVLTHYWTSLLFGPKARRVAKVKFCLTVIKPFIDLSKWSHNSLLYWRFLKNWFLATGSPNFGENLA